MIHEVPVKTISFDDIRDCASEEEWEWLQDQSDDVIIDIVENAAEAIDTFISSTGAIEDAINNALFDAMH